MGTYIRLVDIKNSEEKEKGFFDVNNYYIALDDKFQSIPGQVYAYWVSEGFNHIFNQKNKIADFSYPRQGLHTGDNNTYLRLWYEVDAGEIMFEDSDVWLDSYKWAKLNKGGSFRKWYGNLDYVILWKNNGQQLKNSKKSVGASNSTFLKNLIGFTDLTSYIPSFRFYGKGFVYDVSGPSMINDGAFYSDQILLGLLNSKVTEVAMSILSPTLHMNQTALSRISLGEFNDDEKRQLHSWVDESVQICRDDWDGFETSWNYCKHPLRGDGMSRLISEKYQEWEKLCDKRREELKQNEEALNEYFINLYGLEHELDSEVKDDDISARKADLCREIKSLISYAVGCIMGRYSLKEDGVIYAGGEWDEERYSADFKPCEYGVMPITENQFFEEDLCTRVIDFIKVVYGEDTLADNLKFIASALKPDTYEAPKKVIRDYLFNDFFDNHYQIYQHRPIYWQLDSGKSGGFRAIVYMHRYNENTLPIVRTEFIQDLRYKYEEEMQRQKGRLEGASSTAESNAIKKDIAALDKKIVECAAYDELLNHATSSIQNYLFDLDDGVKTNYAKFLSIDGDKNSNILTVVKL